ncbi:ATPase, T2SS/T4P/T4SS family [Psychromonas sp. SP041]|uniref:GspE/PulE family protein n=1 Tax=Psychromonas sp. SP041 TaxID=1365007 RepID=UPI00042A5470|nr:ATPase, T2SS/T4P/T4SS family [Psychromonas sp. SP041]
MSYENMTIDERIESYLIEKGMVNKFAIEASKREIEVTGGKLSDSLVRNSFVNQEHIVEAVLKVTDANLMSEEKIVEHIPLQLFKDYHFKVAAETIKDVFISTTGDEFRLAKVIKEYYPEQSIVFTPANPEMIDNYIAKIEMIHDSDASDLENLIRRGISLSASDIHILQRESTYTVFYRIDGVARHDKEGKLKDYLSISARIKDRSSMDMAEKRIPMDGGFDVEHNGRKISLRVASVPLTSEKESIVIRIIDPEKSNIPLGALGITDVAKWRRGSRRLEGLNLICGMTGSGKTTTLSSTMRELDRFGKVIYTAEDPVEHKIPFIRQLNINNDVGLDFNRALKAFMRADPDIIILGEIRDEETARNAIKAAETGHLVFATMHTGSILGSVNRLRDLGVPLFQLKTVIRSVLAQQLIRLECVACDGLVTENKEDSCHICGGSGYKGRTIVSECHYFKDEKEVGDIMENREVKWPTILEDAFSKVLSGKTNVGELIRIFGPDAEDIMNERKEELESLGLVDKVGISNENI